jgi:pimeloyl-ACP methyl ester carboxylesterase
MGGVTALHAIGDGLKPELEAVVFVDIVPHPDARGIARIRDFMTAHLDGFGSLDEAVDAVAAYNPHRSRPSSSDGLARNLRKRNDGRFYWHWDPKILLPESHSDISGETLERCCAAVTMPAALVRGLASDVVTDDSVETFQTMVEGLEVIDVAEAGHMVAGDENDVFVEGLQAFLERHMPVG